MDEYLIEKFWDDYFKYPGQRQTSFALKNLLKGLERHNQSLPEKSLLWFPFRATRTTAWQG